MFKKVIAMLALVVSVNAFAEASFSQVETLIEQKQFQSAEIALEGIIANHPNSAKAFYAMAQAQAGIGNLEKAQHALNKARALDPDLKFASSSNIESLQQAITPQTKKIEVVTESHFWRNFVYFVMFCIFAWAVYFFWCTYNRKKDEEEGCGGNCGGCGPKPSSPTPPTPQAKVDAVNAQPLRTTTSTSSYASTPAPAPVASSPTVVNNHYGSNNDGFVTGMLVGNMLSGSHHDHTTVIERDVYVPTPTPSYTPAPSRDSSWDDDSSSRSSSKSSSWDDDSSSSKSSSSWSSSSSDSDSSWSSSSSSDSSWGDSGSSSDSW